MLLWLSQQQGSVSKADIQKCLKENRVQIVEVVKGQEISDVQIKDNKGNKIGVFEFKKDKDDKFFSEESYTSKKGKGIASLSFLNSKTPILLPLLYKSMTISAMLS